jgi:hypothetical protein
MLLTGLQIVSLAVVANDGIYDCKVTKLAGENSEWAKVVQISVAGVEKNVWINPNGQIVDAPPAKTVKR